MSLQQILYPLFLALIASYNCQNIPSEVKDLADANTDFGLELYNEIKDDSDNVFLSPYSISVALAMLYRGADGKTKEEVWHLIRCPMTLAYVKAARKTKQHLSQQGT